jgi:nanoRNase/pAp phosphatase (c-di-AMP/oligoRNAs hydrolase)
MRNLDFAGLCSFIKSHKDSKVALTFHTIGDRDGVGSAVALSEYFTGASVVTPDFITNNARRMLAYLGLEGTVGMKFPSDADLVIILDTNNFFALGKHQDEIKAFKGEVLFIDHHSPNDGLPDNVLMFNDETFNSTASITYALMKGIGAEVNRETAVLLLNGITADSADLQNSFPETFRQIAELLDISKTDFSFFSNYIHKAVPVRNKYTVISDVLRSKVEVLGNYIMIYGRATEHANIAADTALKIDADATVFWVTSGTEASVSARLRPPLDKELDIHLGAIMKEIGGIVGGNGGGHACAAGAYGSKREMAQQAGEEAVKKIREKIEAANSKRNSRNV